MMDSILLKNNYELFEYFYTMTSKMSDDEDKNNNYEYMFMLQEIYLSLLYASCLLNNKKKYKILITKYKECNDPDVITENIYRSKY